MIIAANTGRWIQISANFCIKNLSGLRDELVATSCQTRAAKVKDDGPQHIVANYSCGVDLPGQQRQYARTLSANHKPFRVASTNNNLILSEEISLCLFALLP
jgi:hypothetical protein